MCEMQNTNLNKHGDINEYRTWGILRLNQDHISYHSHLQPEAMEPAVTG